MLSLNLIEANFCLTGSFQGDKTTTYGAIRASLGYPNPFTIDYVEIGNEDYLNGGSSYYYSYRFDAFYNAIHAAYPSLHLISTINPSPVTTTGSEIDLHIYGNENYFVGLFGTFDQASRKYPVFVAEYAAIQVGSQSGQCGAQTLGMACAEAIFLLGCERNSDIILGTSYGALIKNYNEAPDTVAVIKHTANEILLTMSYYVQKLFADYQGTVTLPVTATGGGFGPLYWSATKSSTATILKMVNHNGSPQTVVVNVKGSSATSATLVTLTAPNSSSVNNLPGLGGIATEITTTTIKGSGGTFSVPITSGYEILVLSV
jgi:alpha-N-arabinofuranosidase